MSAAARSAEVHLGAWLRAQEAKGLLRFVAIGSVDDGKSTLIGRLLHDAHSLYEDQLNAVRRASAKGATRGGTSASEIDFSLFTDGLAAEREQGITIDVAYRYFATEKRKFIIADTPGHVQYTRNMATGASTADAALVLVDARLGVLEQTRRHARIAALLGIRHLVACVNKMDLVGYDEAVFQRIRVDLDAVVREASEGAAEVFAIPISALRGDNVVGKSEAMAWWDGPTVLHHLETLPLGTGDDDAPLRLPVQLVLRPNINYRGFAGRIVSGALAVGDEVVALPSGRRSRVVGIDVAGATHESAVARENVSVRLADEIDVSRGDMLVKPGEEPIVAGVFDADLVWMSERLLDPGKAYLLKHTTRRVRATVEADRAIGLNDIARVRVKAHAPLFFDPYRKNRGTGSFVLIDSVTNDTVAAGMIAAVAPKGEGKATSKTQVSDDERRARLGHAGVLVTVAARTTEDAATAAFGLERELFDAGLVAVVVRGGDDAARACVRAGLVAIVAREGETAITVDGAATSVEGIVRAARG